MVIKWDYNQKFQSKFWNLIVATKSIYTNSLNINFRQKWSILNEKFEKDQKHQIDQKLISQPIFDLIQPFLLKIDQIITC